MGNSKSSDQLIVLREMPQKVRELHYAVMSNDRQSVIRLTQDGVNVNFPWYNPSIPSMKDGTTPLICAVSLNHTDIVEVLIRAGAYINKCDRWGCTPIYKAAFHGRPALIELLSKSGADVNLADYLGKTPLYICVNNAVVHANTVAVQKLLAAGAIVDKYDKMGRTPIHLAAQWKLKGILQLLIRTKSQVNITDNRGRTPLYVSVSTLSTRLYAEDVQQKLECIYMLYKAGADMLNLTSWLLYKGPGISNSLLNQFPEFKVWYLNDISTPTSLKNICRKVIQRTISCHGNLVDISFKLPLPHSLQTIISRKMFYRELDEEEWRIYHPDRT